MFVVDETLRDVGQQGTQTGLWMLAIFMLGLSVMAYLTVREASLNESKTAARNLKRLAKAAIPDRENLSVWSRSWLFLQGLARGRAFREVVDPATSQGTTPDDIRLRREIDRLVGKDVYHGQKEQL